MKSTWRAYMGGVAAAAVLAGAPAWAQLNQAVQTAEQATAAAAASQARIDRVDDERGDLFREYRATLQRIDSQALFVEQQKVFLQSQDNEIADVRAQLDDVEGVLANLLPMQFEMIAALEEFVKLDIPFRYDERIDRLRRLRETMDQPPTDVPPAEKYRKIIEAYEIETDYGRFLDTYAAPLAADPRNVSDPDAPQVDYLRIGRVAFIYMSKDESQLGIWNAQTNSWDPLPASFRSEVRRAIRIAKEITTPDVFFAPVPGATRVDG